MIWFDLVTPKSVLFFAPIIKEIMKKGDVLITSRGDSTYTEVNELLDLMALDYTSYGSYGGANLKGKLTAALNRQVELNEFIQEYKIDCLINLCSVDACRVAFGNGIKIVNFCDFPTGKDDKLTHVAKLTLPLSDKIFYPFYIPKSIFSKYCENIIEYDFLDPIIYLQTQDKDDVFFTTLNIDKTKKTILYREEEHKASYVDKQRVFIEEILNRLDVNLIIIPRYEYQVVQKKFPNAIVLKEKIELSSILPFSDVFVGGGGTINIEACYWNVPVISTRSFLCYYDRYLINQNLMFHVSNEDEFFEIYNKLDRIKMDNSCIIKEVNIQNLIKQIKE